MTTAAVACAPLAEAGDVQRFGGKAAGLARLLRAGHPVPGGFAIPVEAHADWIQAGSPADRLPESWSDAVVRAVSDLDATRLAVRSSAAAEDGGAASFAGQHLTELEVAPSDVPAAVARCLASTASEASDAYRATRGVDAGLMAVVVQEMVDARAAGVCFTADPITGARDRIVVEAVEGLGEALVSGQAQPDRFVLSREGEVAERVTVGARPVLGDAQAAQVAALAIAAEEDGAAVDVEWAIDGSGRVLLLQARPITVVGAPADLEPWLADVPPRPDERWTRAVGDEFWADATSPFYFAAMGRHIDEDNMKDMDRLQGLHRLDCSRPYLRLHGGRAYWAESAMLETLRVTPPAFRSDRLLGWFSPESREAARAIPYRPWEVLKATVNGRRRDPDGRIERNHTLLEQFMADSRRRAAAFTVAPKVSVEDLDARWAELEDWLRQSFRFVRWGLSVHSTMLVEVLTRLCGSWLGDAGLVGTLVAGLPTRTLDANRDLWLVGQEEDGPAFDTALAAFLERHGHRRATREPAEPSWREDPAGVAILARSTRGTIDPADVLVRSARTREQAEREALARLDPVRRRVFAKVLQYTRIYLTYRDDQRYDADRLFGSLREWALACGDRAVADGRLGDREAAFMLTPRELRRVLAGDERPHPGGWAGLVAARRASYERSKLILPPMWLHGDRTVASSAGGEVADGDALEGMAVSPGIVEGIARVIPTLATADRLGPGEVLVTSNTDPGWTPLFLRAAGLVLETGGMLAHGAIIAREYGLPAVSAIPQATRRIPDGCRVRVDGAAGTVVVLDEAG